jgi:DNA-binding MarR family transcriptional regulator
MTTRVTDPAGPGGGPGPDGTPEPRDADPAEAGRALIRLGSRLHRLYAETIEGLSVPLSVQQYRILDRVGEGVSTLSKLAELARRQPPTISKSVDSLVRQGLLNRSESPGDRRATVLRLTPAGTALLGEAHDALDRLARWLVESSGADPGPLTAFAEALYDQTEPELDQLINARRTPGRARTQSAKTSSAPLAVTARSNQACS